MASCSSCKEAMPITRRRWGFMPVWFFPRELRLYKWRGMVLCDDCLARGKAKILEFGSRKEVAHSSTG